MKILVLSFFISFDFDSAQVSALIGAKDTFACYNRMKAFEKVFRKTKENNWPLRTMPLIGSCILRARACRIKFAAKLEQIKKTEEMLQEMQLSAVIIAVYLTGGLRDFLLHRSIFFKQSSIFLVFFSV